MKLSQVKKQLNNLTELHFMLPDGTFVPKHFHITEVGKITRQFIDCGGVIRTDEAINFQLYYADDFDHRLTPKKLAKIIALSEDQLTLQDLEIEVEYQTSSTIGKYGLECNDKHFTLTPKLTDCLAKDNCGIPEKKPRIRISTLQNNTNCAPESGCC